MAAGKKPRIAKQALSNTLRESSSAASTGPLTPRSVAPPVIPEPVHPPKVQAKTPGKTVVRAAYVPPAQRVLDAQQLAQSRSRRMQPPRDDSTIRVEPGPASEGSARTGNGAVSSESKTGAGFVRRGRLGPRDPNSGPGSEPQSSPTAATGSFEKEWRLIVAAARRATVKLDRDLVQGWLEPWLSGKDTLALIQSATNSGDGYFIATQALARKTLLVQRADSEAAEIAAHWTRLGLNVYALLGSVNERKAILSRFNTAGSGTLVVPLSAFDDNALVTELQQCKI